MGLQYPERPSEDVVFRDNFINEDYVEDNGGTIVNDAIIDNGVTTDGTHDYISYGDVADLGDDNFSFSFKVSFPDAGTQEYIFSKWEDANNRWYIRRETTGQVFMYCLVGGTIRISAVSAAGAMSDADTEYEIVVAGDWSDTLRFYVDGVESVGSVTTFTNDDITNTGPLEVGRASTGYGEFTMKDLSIYNRALTEEEAVDISEKDTFLEVVAQKSRYWLPMRTNYQHDSLRQTGSIGLYQGTITMGDGADDTSLYPVQGDGYFGFDGVADYVNVGGNADFNYDEPQSFSFMYRTDSAGTEAIISKSEGASGYKGWQVYQVSGVLNFRIYYNGIATGIRVGTDNSFDDNRWHHAVVTYDGSGLASGVKHYIDGNLEASTAAIDAGFGGDTTNSEDLNIGRASYDSIPFDGDLYDVAQWSEELTPTQVKELFNNRRII